VSCPASCQLSCVVSRVVSAVVCRVLRRVSCRDLVRRATRRRIGDHPGVPVADLADVIASKAAAGRAKDLLQLPALRRLLERLRTADPGRTPGAVSTPDVGFSVCVYHNTLLVT